MSLGKDSSYWLAEFWVRSCQDSLGNGLIQGTSGPDEIWQFSGNEALKLFDQSPSAGLQWLPGYWFSPRLWDFSFQVYCGTGKWEMGKIKCPGKWEMGKINVTKLDKMSQIFSSFYWINTSSPPRCCKSFINFKRSEKIGSDSFFQFSDCFR